MIAPFTAYIFETGDLPSIKTEAKERIHLTDLLPKIDSCHNLQGKEKKAVMQF